MVLRTETAKMRVAACALALAAAGAAHATGRGEEECAKRMPSGIFDSQRKTFMAECMAGSSDWGPTQASKHFIEDFGFEEVNSVGGVDPYFEVYNPTKDTIKYVAIRMTPFNAVGDPVASRIGRQVVAGLRYTGQLAPGEIGRASFEPVWYNSTIRCVRVNSVSVEFMNGKRQEFSGKALRAALAPRLRNTCEAESR